MNLYYKLAKEKHQTTWRGHERVKPTIWGLRSLSWPAFIWANRFLMPFDPNVDILLDLGGASGNFASLFKNRVKRIIVLDVVNAPLTFITEKEFWRVQGDILRIPLKDESINRIIFSDVFEHFKEEDLTYMLAEIHRILKPEGICFINTSCYGFYLRRYYLKLMGKESDGRLDWADIKDGHLNRMMHSEMLRLFNETGFEVTDWRFSKHFFQPLLQIIKQLILYLLKRPTKLTDDQQNKVLKDQNLKNDSRRLVMLLRGTVNAWSYLDILFFGRIQGGAVYYKLEKK